MVNFACAPVNMTVQTDFIVLCEPKNLCCCYFQISYVLLTYFYNCFFIAVSSDQHITKVWCKFNCVAGITKRCTKYQFFLSISKIPGSHFATSSHKIQMLVQVAKLLYPVNQRTAHLATETVSWARYAVFFGTGIHICQVKVNHLNHWATSVLSFQHL